MEELKTSNVHLIKGDCLNIMGAMKENSVDLCITDPPYKLVQGGCTNKAVRLKGATDLKSGAVFENNNVKFSEWIPQVFRILKNGSHCYIMCNDRNLQELLNESSKAGFKLLNILVWKKSRHSPNRYYLKNAEFIVFLRKGNAKNINNMGDFQVMEFDNVKNKTHPSEKPIELLNHLLQNSININDKTIVIDPFVGTGSMCEAVVKSNLPNVEIVGIEISNEYFDIAYNRINGYIYE